MIAIACDHGGYDLKVQLLAHLKERGLEVEDLGCGPGERVDYPLYADRAAEAVLSGACDRAILVCGTGIGVSIAANRYPGIRATLCGDCYSAEMSRAHNDSNILCLGGRTLGPALALRILDIWLDTPFSGAESHVRRVKMLSGDRS